MDKFEYKILNISREHMKGEDFQAELMEKLNSLGDQSWELINVEGLNGSSVLWRVSETVDILFLFKRRKLS